MPNLVSSSIVFSSHSNTRANLLPSAGTDRLFFVGQSVEVVGADEADVLFTSVVYRGQTAAPVDSAIAVGSAARGLQLFVFTETQIAAIEAGSGDIALSNSGGALPAGSYNTVFCFTLNDCPQSVPTSFIAEGLDSSGGDALPHSVTITGASTDDLAVFIANHSQPDNAAWTGATEQFDVITGTFSTTIAVTDVVSDGNVTAGITPDGGTSYSTNIIAFAISAASAPANQPPAADDDTFSIPENASNGAVVGTYSATDSDGTVDAYSITGTALAIDNAGQITVLDNTGFSAGGQIVETVTATDDDGATDTGQITVNITNVKPAITTVSAIRLGESFTINVDGTVDISAASTLSATLNGVALSGQANLTANSVDFDAPNAGLQVGASYDVVITADGQASDPSSETLLAPTGMQAVTLASIDPESKFANPPYSGNGGSDADNMGANDQVLISLLSSPGNYSVTLSDTGIIGLVGASGETVDQAVSVFYLDAQDSYARSGTTVLTLEIQTADTTDPVITLTGNSTVTHAHGTAYNDAGATATDNVDGDISGDIVVTGSVDTNTVGQYVLSYNVQDAAGNDAVQVQRTINVTDQANPVITLTGSTPINLDEGDTYTEQGATWVDAVDGSGSAVVGGDTVDTSTPGTYTVTYNFTDASGNVADTVTRSVVVAAVDNTAPVIALLGSASVEVNQGQVYTDQGATATDNNDGDITGSITVQSNVDTSTPGTYTVTYNVSDAAGNPADEVSRSVQVIAQPTLNQANQVPDSITLRYGVPYPLSQHVVNPSGNPLTYRIASGSPALNASVSLDESTGELSLVTAVDSLVTGLSIEVLLA